MTSRERVRAAIARKPIDRIPCDFSATEPMMRRLAAHFGAPSREALLERFGADIRYIGPDFTGPREPDYIDTDGLRVEHVYWGYTQKYYPAAEGDFYPMNTDYPWNFAGSARDITEAPWITPDMFDYESVKRRCDQYPDKALMIGGAGVYQFATFMREASALYMDMAAEPELAQAVFDRFVSFELEHYERIFLAADGRVDLLVCNDDYGTQQGMLFSVPMWRRFFAANTKRLADLAHRYGAYYMQHSCGAVRPILGELIACGADALDPIQKVAGMEPEGLKRDFGDRLAFHGGIDTQRLLPRGTAGEVRAEADRFVRILGAGGGYILAPSQCFQTDVPPENVEAMYSVRA